MSYRYQRLESFKLGYTFLISVLIGLLFPATAWAGGPRFIAGSSYFDPAVLGQPVHWKNGVLNYYVDQGPLNEDVSGQTVSWDANCGCDIAVQGDTAATSNSTGIAVKMLTASPKTEGALSTATACVNGTPNCADFSVLGARPEFATVQAVTGAIQSVSVSSAPSQIVLRVHDLNGNPMAGGRVTLYQSLYAWAPPCPPHGRCASSPLLATQVSTATSDNSGLVVFTPASIPGVPTNTVATATTGNFSSLPIAIEIHP